VLNTEAANTWNNHAPPRCLRCSGLGLLLLARVLRGCRLLARIEVHLVALCLPWRPSPERDAITCEVRRGTVQRSFDSLRQRAT